MPTDIMVLFMWRNKRIVAIEVTGRRADGSPVGLHYGAFDPQAEEIAFWRELAAAHGWAVSDEARDA